MTVKKITQRIKSYFHDYHVDIKLQPLSITKEEVLLFQVIPKPGVQQKSIFAACSDVQCVLQIPLFHLYKNDLRLFLAISWKKVKTRSLIAVLKSNEFTDCNSTLPVALGYDMLGNITFDDLSKMSSLLIGGAGNSGKSVALKCLTTSLVVTNTVNQLSLLIIDVGADSLDLFQTVPHLAHPIVKDAKAACYIVRKLVDEMNRRNKEDSCLTELPKIVCVIDEFISLMANITDKSQVDELKKDLLNLTTRGRHVGIHTVLAAQNPTRENLVIDLASTTARMAFRCAKVQNSVTILGEGGAEKLTQKGTFLYKSPTQSKTMQYQGPYISDEEVKALMEKVIGANSNLCNQFTINTFDETKIDEAFENKLIVSHDCKKDKELAQIIVQVLSCDTISVNQLKEAFKMGNRANEIMDIMCKFGIVSDKNANKPRKVLPKTIADIPEYVVSFLEENGVTSEKIYDILERKA